MSDRIPTRRWAFCILPGRANRDTMNLGKRKRERKYVSLSVSPELVLLLYINNSILIGQPGRASPNQCTHRTACSCSSRSRKLAALSWAESRLGLGAGRQTCSPWNKTENKKISDLCQPHPSGATLLWHRIAWSWGSPGKQYASREHEQAVRCWTSSKCTLEDLEEWCQCFLFYF